MKLTDRQKQLIADFAHQFSLDNANGMSYPVTDSWMYGLVEVMKREGYEIHIIPKCVISSLSFDDVDTKLQWEFPSREGSGKDEKGFKREAYYNRKD